MRIIKHGLVRSKNYMALLPYGDYLNSTIFDCDSDDLFVTLDDNIVRVISKSVIPIKSDIAESMSIAIYGAPMKLIYKRMKKLWGRDINRETVMLVVLERLGWSDEIKKEVNKENKNTDGEEEDSDDFLWKL